MSIFNQFVLKKEKLNNLLKTSMIQQDITVIYNLKKLNFTCVDCGKCCDQALIQDELKQSKMLVPINSFDLRRFKNFKNDTLNFPFYFIDELKVENETIDITLRKHGLKCAFFNPKKMNCAIYKVRPNTCSLYPYEIQYNSSESVINFSIKGNNVCPPEAFETKSVVVEDEIKEIIFKFLQISLPKQSQIDNFKSFKTENPKLFDLDTLNQERISYIIEKILQESPDFIYDAKINKDRKIKYFFFYSSLDEKIINKYLEKDRMIIKESIEQNQIRENELGKVTLHTFGQIQALILYISWISEDYEELGKTPVSILYNMYVTKSRVEMNDKNLPEFMKDISISNQIIETYYN